MAEKALTAVILETNIQGISTLPIHDLLKAMGNSRLCGEIDVKVETFLDRPIDGERSYIRIGATHLKVRRGGRIVPVAAMLAVGVSLSPLSSRKRLLRRRRRPPARSGAASLIKSGRRCLDRPI
jgi:transposase-like protein